MAQLMDQAAPDIDDAVNDFSRQLDQELARRINALEQSPHVDSDCFQPAKPIITESACWAALGFAVWIVTLLILHGRAP